MLSAKLPKTSIVNIEINMFWDGLFHAFCWLTVAVGISLLWKAGKSPGAHWSGKSLAGSALAGWGLFNLVEGLVDHHMLQVHHVVERAGLSIWDWIFLASGAAMILAGFAIARSTTANSA